MDSEYDQKPSDCSEMQKVREEHAFMLNVLQHKQRREILSFFGSGKKSGGEIEKAFCLNGTQAEYHLALLKQAWLIENAEGGYGLTKRGIFFLQNECREMIMDILREMRLDAIISRLYVFIDIERPIFAVYCQVRSGMEATPFQELMARIDRIVPIGLTNSKSEIDGGNIFFFASDTSLAQDTTTKERLGKRLKRPKKSVFA